MAVQTLTKHRIRAAFERHSEDLINNFFMHPYPKVELVERDLQMSRLTTTKHLDALPCAGLVQAVKVGRTNYYVNVTLNAILTRIAAAEGASQ